MEIPAQLGAERAITQQNIALSVIKQAHEQEKLLVGILDNSVKTIAASHRGSHYNNLV